MKTIRNLTLILLAFVAASCSDDEVNYAPLSVTQVTDINHEQVLQSADLAQYIVIQGTGLNAVQSIMFNDIAVDMLEAYVTENEIVLSIPRVIPTNVNNLITLKSATETVTVPFEVFVPELQVSGMGNEFALPGEEMTVVGDFFDLYEITTESGQLFFGDQEMEITRAVEDTLYFTLPEDAQAGTQIRIVSELAGERTVPGRYRERGNMLCDYDPFTGWGGGDYICEGPTSDMPDSPDPISGNYSRFKLAEGDAADWDWSNTTTIAMIGVTYDQDILDNPSNYLLKFEVNTLMALTKRQIRFYFSQINYDWEPFASGLAFNTNGEWSTVTIDLSEAWKGDVPADGTLQILGNSYAEDTDICFDNFRIVPKE